MQAEYSDSPKRYKIATPATWWGKCCTEDEAADYTLMRAWDNGVHPYASIELWREAGGRHWMIVKPHHGAPLAATLESSAHDNGMGAACAEAAAAVGIEVDRGFIGIFDANGSYLLEIALPH